MYPSPNRRSFYVFSDSNSFFRGYYFFSRIGPGRCFSVLGGFYTHSAIDMGIEDSILADIERTRRRLNEILPFP